MIGKSFPTLSLVCLETANVVNIGELVGGRDAVIDFWTTGCERCPRGLDKLDVLAGDPKHRDIIFISICCDKLDGARNMIDEEDKPRWSNIRHYFIDASEKKKVKKYLGIGSVPFYVAVDKDGTVCDSGGAGTFDLEGALLLMGHATFLRAEHSSYERDCRDRNVGNQEQRAVVLLERVFVLDEEF